MRVVILLQASVKLLASAKLGTCVTCATFGKSVHMQECSFQKYLVLLMGGGSDPITGDVTLLEVYECVYPPPLFLQRRKDRELGES